jgi:hypothetical protein
VRLVDGEHRDLGRVEQPQRRLRAQSLRRQVEQVELAALNCCSTTCLVPGSWVELRKSARMPSWRSACTWSCMSAISGEMTTPVPGRTSAGIW